MISSEQKKALNLQEDAFVVAGAGAGKTTTLVECVKHDLEQGISPERIMVSTFTRAAAKNVTSRLGLNGERVWIGTIDSICSRFVRENALEVALSPDFQVGEERVLVSLQKQSYASAVNGLEEVDFAPLAAVVDLDGRDFIAELKMIHEQMRSRSLSPSDLLVPDPEDLNLSELIACIDALIPLASDTAALKLSKDREALEKGDLEELSLGAYGRVAQELQPQFSQVKEGINRARSKIADHAGWGARTAYKRLLEKYDLSYTIAKREAQVLDFTDLAEFSLDLIHRGVGERFKRVYIDEAQDTSPLQLEVLRGLADGPVISIGDISQSIYSFRRADVENFKRSSQGAKRVVLRENYRSHPSLLPGINSLTGSFSLGEAMRAAREDKEDDESRIKTILVSSAESAMPSTSQEALSAVPEVMRLVREQSIPLSEVCFLTRTNAEVMDYTHALRSHNVPAVAIQKSGLLSQEEVIDVLAYLRLLASREDEEALLRVLASPFCDASENDILQCARAREEDVARLRRELKDLSPDDPEYPTLWQWVREGMGEFSRVFERVQSLLGSASVSDVLKTAIREHNYDLSLELIDSTGSKLRNVEKVLEWVQELEMEVSGPMIQSVVKAVEEEMSNEIAVSQSTSVDEEAVRVMTIHQAKGEEFTVCVLTRLSRPSRTAWQRFWLSEEGEIGMRINGVEDSVARVAREERTHRERSEEERLLYVALTRARDWLVLVAGRKRKKGEGLVLSDRASQLLSSLTLPLHEEEVLPQILQDEFSTTSVEIIDVPMREDISPPSPISLTPAEEMVVSAKNFSASSSNRISYTALSRWRKCGLRKHLERDLKLSQSTLSLESTGKRELGVRVHEELAAWRGGRILGDFPDEIRAALEDLERSPLAQKVQAATQVESEKGFWVRVGDWLLHGKIDLIMLNDDHATVIDWKSGQESASSDHLLQRKLYALAVLKSERARVTAITYHLLDRSKEEDEFDDPLSLEEDLTKQIKSILNAKPHPSAKTAEAFCAECPGLERVCPVSHSLSPR